MTAHQAMGLDAQKTPPKKTSSDKVRVSDSEKILSLWKNVKWTKPDSYNQDASTSLEIT